MDVGRLEGHAQDRMAGEVAVDLGQIARFALHRSSRNHTLRLLRRYAVHEVCTDGNTVSVQLIHSPPGFENGKALEGEDECPGVTLRDIRQRGREIEVEIAAEPGVSYTTQFIGTRKRIDTRSTAQQDPDGHVVSRRYDDEIGEVLASVPGTSPTYCARGDELYVRAKVILKKVPAKPWPEGQVETAWTQPFTTTVTMLNGTGAGEIAIAPSAHEGGRFRLPRSWPRRLGLGVCLALGPASGHAQAIEDWPIHSRERPHPPVVDPGTPPVSVPPPSDAIVLFDGRDLSQWRSTSGGPAPWKVVDGHFEAVPGSGAIQTARSFGDVQLHVEWATPAPPTGGSQGRGNRGVVLMGEYELQVLDSYDNTTYADGQAGVIYGQYPPLANASRPPGEWQSYDIAFRRPHFNAQGQLSHPARFTVFHDEVLIQYNVELTGPTASRSRPPFEAHAARLPLALQDHSNPVRFRNIWIREIPDQPEVRHR